MPELTLQHFIINIIIDIMIIIIDSSIILYIDEKPFFVRPSGRTNIPV